MSRRLRKWKAKTEPEVVGERLKQTRELGVEKQETYQPQLHELNMKVKAVLNELGIPAHLHHYYTSAGQEFWKLQKKGAEGPVNTEADGIAAGWVTRGLDFGVLQQVAALFGYNPRLMILEADCPAGVDLCDLNPQDVAAAPDPGISTKASRCDHVHKGPPAHAPSHASDGSDPLDHTAYNVCKLAIAYNSIVQGTWIITVDANNHLNGALFNNSNTQNDEVQYKFSHKAGSFTVCLLYHKYTSFGIMTIYIDGVLQGTIDGYGVTSYNNIGTVSCSILTDGEHTLNIKVTDKNPSSSGYFAAIGAWWIRD